MLAYIGGFKALWDTPALHRSGFIAWLLWNAAYITKLVSVRNKVMDSNGAPHTETTDNDSSLLVQAASVWQGHFPVLKEGRDHLAASIATTN